MQFDMKILKAVRFACSSEETRYYLKGVFVNVVGDKIRMVATDGHRMIVSQQPHTVDCHVDYSTGFIIPLKMIDKIKLAKKRKGNDAPQALLSLNGAEITIKYDGETYVDQTIDGTFPDYRRVIPKDWSKEAAQYNPAYLVDFSKAINTALPDATTIPVVCHNGLNPALVHLGDADGFDWFGVIMPIQVKKDYMPITSWALPVSTDAAAAA